MGDLETVHQVLLPCEGDAMSDNDFYCMTCHQHVPWTHRAEGHPLFTPVEGLNTMYERGFKEGWDFGLRRVHGKVEEMLKEGLVR